MHQDQMREAERKMVALLLNRLETVGDFSKEECELKKHAAKMFKLKDVVTDTTWILEEEDADP